MAGQHKQQEISFGMIHHPSSSIHGGFMGKEGGSYDIGELDQALFMYLEGQDPSSAQEQKETLNIFPSQPTHVQPPATTKVEKIEQISNSKVSHDHVETQPEQSGNDSNKITIKKEASKKGDDGLKTPDPKTLRRLSQNREAAKKSRLRKKAYVQQLENSRIRLSQIEQELHRARAQGFFFGGGAVHGDQGVFPGSGCHISQGKATMFDMEYGRWLEEHHRLMCELRAATAAQEHVESAESELRSFVDHCVAHYDELFTLKSIITRIDAFHLISGRWKTPAERCFLWLGGFRPSDLIKIVLNHIQPLTEQQLLGVCALQQSTHETEAALNQGLEAVNRSLSEAVTSDVLTYPSDMANYMGQMALAMNRLSSLEGFVRQADNLRQQTLHRLHQLLTARQSARCFLAIAGYFHRLRALSSLWLSRPRQD